MFTIFTGYHSTVDDFSVSVEIDVQYLIFNDMYRVNELPFNYSPAWIRTTTATVWSAASPYNSGSRPATDSFGPTVP